VTVDPTGRFVYAANEYWSNDVSAFAIDGTSGALTPVPGSPFPAVNYADSVTVDPTGQFAYAGNFQGHNISAYIIDGTSGALTPIAGSPFPTPGAWPI